MDVKQTAMVRGNPALTTIGLTISIGGIAFGAASIIGRSGIPFAGGKTTLSAGTFTFDERVDIDRSNVFIEGQGPEATVIRLADGGDDNLFKILPTANRSSIVFENLKLDGNGANQSDTPVRDDRCLIHIPDNPFTIANLQIHDIVATGCRHGAALRIADTLRFKMSGCVLHDNGFAGASHGCDGIYTGDSEDVQISECSAVRNTDTGFAFDNDEFLKVVICHSQDNVEQQFSFARGSNHGLYQACYGRGGKFGLRTGLFGGNVKQSFLTINGCEWTDASEYGVTLEDTDNVTMVGNTFAANRLGPVLRVRNNGNNVLAPNNGYVP